MRIETERLLITDFTLDMAEAVHLNSLDEDTRLSSVAGYSNLCTCIWFASRDWGAFFGAMLFGIMVGWLYWRTGSIIPGSIIHVVNNSLSFIDLNNQPHTICIVILIVCLLLLVYGLWWFGKKCNFAGEVNQDLPKV